MKAKAEIQLRFSSDRHLKKIIKALMPEASSPVSKRSNIELRKEANSLIMLAESVDTIALRATINTYLRWAESLKKILELVDSLS